MTLGARLGGQLSAPRVPPQLQPHRLDWVSAKIRGEEHEACTNQTTNQPPDAEAHCPLKREPRGLFFCGQQGSALVVRGRKGGTRGRVPGEAPPPASWPPMSGFSSPPTTFSISPSFLCRFPLLSLASFIILWGSISAPAGNARAQLGSQESGVVRSEKGRGERGLS